MARPKQKITASQVEGLAAILDVTFELVADPPRTDCYNYHRDYQCPNRVTQNAVCGGGIDPDLFGLLLPYLGGHQRPLSEPADERDAATP